MADILAHDLREGGDPVFGDAGLGTHLAGRAVKRRPRDIALGLQSCHPILECRIGNIGDTVFDSLVNLPKPPLSFTKLLSQRRETLRLIGIARGLPLDQAGQQRADALRRQQLFDDLPGNNIIEPVHRHGSPFAGDLALLGACTARVVAIAAGLACTQCHAAAAAGAGRKSGEQDRPGDDTRRGDPRVAGAQHRLHRTKRVDVNDRIDGDGDLVGLGLRFFGLPDLAVKAVLALVGRACQDLVQLPDPPARADARAVAALVQPGGESFDAHRPACAVALAEQPEHQAHGFSFDRIDSEPLLDLRASLLGSDHRIAVGRLRAVP